MVSDISDPDYWPFLAKDIMRVLGFDTRQYSETFLKRRIQTRLSALHLTTYKEYSHILTTASDEKDNLSKELTIHVTNFFRDRSMWDAFMKSALPLLVEYKGQNKNKNISIWSAGCSSGEEALSIAICLKEVLGPSLSGFKCTIQGTDIDTDTVNHAREAKYTEAQFREMPPEYFTKYFEKDAEGNYRPKPEISSLTKFSQGDIIKDKPRNMDIIFCRNTVIYFDSITKSKLYEELYGCLNSGGLFIMGKTEILQGPAREKFFLYDAHERIHLKE